MKELTKEGKVGIGACRVVSTVRLSPAEMEEEDDEGLFASMQTYYMDTVSLTSTESLASWDSDVESTI